MRTGPERYIVVNKNSFLLQVFERRGEADQIVYEATVALGMDACKPKERADAAITPNPVNTRCAGRCMTRRASNGASRNTWKTNMPRISPTASAASAAPSVPTPSTSARATPSTVPAGPTCWGARSPAAVRAANADMRKIYRLMDVGDKVIITE